MLVNHYFGFVKKKKSLQIRGHRKGHRHSPVAVNGILRGAEYCVAVFGWDIAKNLRKQRKKKDRSGCRVLRNHCRVKNERNKKK